MTSLPAQRLVLKEPPKVVDPQACHALANALLPCVEALRHLASDPVIVAASPNRFNDIYWSEWQAVRCGEFFAEQHDYERCDYPEAIAQAEPEPRRAAALLDVLEEGGWRQLFAKGFGQRWMDEALFLVRQGTSMWLVFCSSNSSDAAMVFAVSPDGTPTYAGKCIERFDQEMSDGDAPMQFEPVANAQSWLADYRIAPEADGAGDES